MLRPAAVVVAAHRPTAFAAHAPALRRLAGLDDGAPRGRGRHRRGRRALRRVAPGRRPGLGARALHEALGEPATDVAEPTAV